MNPDKALLLAVLFGLSVGGTVYRFLLPDWFFVLGIATIYTGVTYFYITYEITLLGEHTTFAGTSDKLGHAVGMFGLSISSLAIIEYAAFRTPEVVGVLVWTTGIVMYLLFISTAQSQRRQYPSSLLPNLVKQLSNE